MASNKKYYWLKLKEDFFDDKTIKYLRKLPDGNSLVIIYLKMQLKSLKTEGFLKYDRLFPTYEEELALVLDEDITMVRFAINALVKIGVVERWENDMLYMASMQQLIGSETAVAERVRQHRALKKKNMKLLQCNTSELQRNTSVTKCNTEIDIDIELDKDINIEQQKKKKLTDKDYDDNFEKLWELLKPNKNDRKSKVIKKRKKELYLMGFERVKKAIELYLKVQDEKYYHKRDNFLNDIIDNYLDKSESDFDVGEVTSSEASYDIDEYENDWKNHQADMLQAFMNKGKTVSNAV